MPDTMSEAVLPEVSVHTPVADWLVPWVDTVWVTLAATTPTRSVQLHLTVTSVLFQPYPLAAGSWLTKVMIGSVVSCTVTLKLPVAVLPCASVAEQSTV